MTSESIDYDIIELEKMEVGVSLILEDSPQLRDSLRVNLFKDNMNRMACILRAYIFKEELVDETVEFRRPKGLLDYLKERTGWGTPQYLVEKHTFNRYAVYPKGPSIGPAYEPTYKEVISVRNWEELDGQRIVEENELNE